MSNSTVIESYQFRPEQLASARPAGISAFIRTRNGADFIEPVIRSHIGFFDEIVAVHNQCSDDTPSILARLHREFGDRLRVFDYLPEVYPPGSDAHVAEPSASPHSLVNYYNIALAQTRYATVLKLDDDQIAIAGEVDRVTSEVRSRGIPHNELWSFSGINVARDDSGTFGVPAIEPVLGVGSHAYFGVDETTYFHHDPRFERFRAPGRKRVFKGVLYWHLKYLKGGFGFSNYGIEAGSNDRYRRKRDGYLAHRRVIDIDELRRLARRHRWAAILTLPTERRRLQTKLWQQIAKGVVDEPAFAALVASLQGENPDRAF